MGNVKPRQWLRGHSLTVKLLLSYIGIMVVGAFLVKKGVEYIYESRFDDSFAVHLQHYLQYVKQDLGEQPTLSKAQQIVDSVPLVIYFQRLDGSADWSTNNQPFPDLTHYKRSRYLSGDISIVRNRAHHLALIENAQFRLAISTLRLERSHPALILVPVTLIILLLLVLFYVTHRLFLPLQSIRSAMLAFGQGRLDKRLNIRRKDALGDVAEQFNEMANQIVSMLEAKRQLLLAISHEIRTPLTRAKLAIALLPASPLQQEIDQELKEIETLTCELLEVERLNSGHQILQWQQLDVMQIYADVIAEMRVAFVCEHANEAYWIEGDERRLKLLLKNLFENAIKYSRPDDKRPCLIIEHQLDHVKLDICDYGEGIDAQHLPYLTDPFYRADAARQRSTGGYGLGLYLCRVICEAHHGSLTIHSEQGVGTQVTVLLPTTRSTHQ